MLVQISPELQRILPLILPKGSGYISSIDYTLPLTARRIDSLTGLDKLETLLTVTLHDDNIALLLQIPGRAAEEVMKALTKYGISGYVIRFWMLGDLDPVANYIAHASCDR